MDIDPEVMRLTTENLSLRRENETLRKENERLWELNLKLLDKETEEELPAPSFQKARGYRSIAEQIQRAQVRDHKIAVERRKQGVKND